MKKVIPLLFALAFWLLSFSKHDEASCHCSNCMDIKIGAMIMAGKGTELSDEIRQAIEKYHIGYVILFDKDVSSSMGERNIT